MTFPHGTRTSWLTNKLDGSEDGLVSDSIYRLVGPELLAYRQQLLAGGLPKSLKELLKKVTPPKGVKGSKSPKKDDIPEDEGTELFDCEGDELPQDGIANEHIEHVDNFQMEAEQSSAETNTATVDVETPEPSTSSDVTLSRLVQEDPEHLHNAQFLDDFQALLERYDGTTSLRFQHDLLRFKQLNTKARQCFKKHYR